MIKASNGMTYGRQLPPHVDRLKTNPQKGETVSITLTFDDGSAKTIEVPVTKLQAMMEMDKGMDHSKMDSGISIRRRYSRRHS